MAVFGPNILIFFVREQKFWYTHITKPGQILIFPGRSKSFATCIIENHLGTLFALFFGRVWHQMGQKCQYLAQSDHRCIFWAKFGLFGPKILIFLGRKQKFLREGSKSFYGKPPRHLVCIVFWSGMGSNGPKMPIFGQKCQFWAKFGRFWAKIHFFLGGGME